MDIFAHHLCPGQYRQTAAFRQPIRGPSWSPQHLPSRWTCERPSYASATPFHKRSATYATPCDGDIHDIGLTGANPGSTGQAPAAASATSSATAAPSPWHLGRLWLGRAACCATATAVALSLLVSADYGVAAAAAAAAVAATPPVTIATTAQDRTVPRLQSAIHMRLHDGSSSGGDDSPVNLLIRQEQQQKLQPPAMMMMTPGLLLVAHPTAQPGASSSANGAAATPVTSSSLYDVVYGDAGRWESLPTPHQSLADVAAGGPNPMALPPPPQQQQQQQGLILSASSNAVLPTVAKYGTSPSPQSLPPQFTLNFRGIPLPPLGVLWQYGRPALAQIQPSDIPPHAETPTTAQYGTGLQGTAINLAASDSRSALSGNNNFINNVITNIMSNINNINGIFNTTTTNNNNNNNNNNSSSSSSSSSLAAARGSMDPGDDNVGPGGVGAVSSELASETEDRLLEVARQVEARVEGVLGALVGGVPQLRLGTDGEMKTQDASTSAAYSLIREVWEVVDNYYLDARATGFNRQRWAELRDAALAMPYRDTAAGYRAIRDMLARGLSDPYCRFIGPSELEAMKKYDVSGVGLNLGTAAEYVIKTGNQLPSSREAAAGEGVFVVGVSKGSIADVAGVRQGDELLEIQGQSLEESTPFRAAGLISGAAEDTSSSSPSPGGDATAEAAATSSSSSSAVGGRQQRRQRGGVPSEDIVRLKLRHTSGKEEELSLVRPRRTLPSAVSTSLTRSSVLLPASGGTTRQEEVVGTVRLASFNARAQADVAAAIRELEAAGATRLVLDLRDNRGGLVTEGLEVARLFLQNDAPIVITERRDAPPDTPRASGPAMTAAPLLVLVNGHTASASEIVAGALHDNCRAVLAGSRTYGKGLIQSVYELSDGSGLVITVGKYLTPRGTDIDRYGIKPDFNSVPSAAQYEGTIKACKLALPTMSTPMVTPPPVFGDVDAAVVSESSISLASGSRSGW